MKSPAAVRQFFKTILNKCVCPFKVDVIAGDAKRCSIQVLQKSGVPRSARYSSVAVMLREMQREVNTGHPLESRLHSDYSTNNHPPQHHAADDLDCCFMAILSR